MTPKEEPKPEGKLDWLIEHIKRMSPREFRESLVRAGIITATGHLTDKYRQGE